MSRHDPDLTSLIAGLVFLAIGVSYLLDATDVIEVQVRWIVPLALIGLGAAGLAGSVLRNRQEGRPPRPPDDASGAYGEDATEPEHPVV